MHRFDYSEILGDIPRDITELMLEITRIRSLEGMRRKNYPKDYLAMENLAKIASVKYSNEIEGIVTTEGRLREIVMMGSDPLGFSEEEIAGYRDALKKVNDEYESMNFDHETILNLHSMINTKGSDRRAYKDVDNAIVSIDQFGRRRLVFEPVPAEETYEHMDQLCLEYMELSTQGYNPLLYIPCIILDYLCIHPFVDGNGRTSRLLTMLLLYKEGIDVCRYVSMDEHISFNKAGYYRNLSLSSEGWKENKWSYFPFIRYFLMTLLKCYRDLEARFTLVDGKRIGRVQTVENVIERNIAPISKWQICMTLPDVSPYTIEKCIKTLLAQGKIEKIGNTKGARYRVKR